VGGGRIVPDFFSLQLNGHYCSSRVRDVFEQHAPTGIEFIAVEFAGIAPERMPAESYYFMNIFTRLNAINWLKTPTVKKFPEFFIADENKISEWKSRLTAPEWPAAWYEGVTDFEGIRYATSETGVFYVSGELGESLNKLFPGQFDCLVIYH
jgi:hypothetical protein